MKFVSFYNSNISYKVVDAQRAVFEKFGCEIEQILTTLQHPQAIDDYLLNKEWSQIAIFDIDCIPLNKKIFKFIRFCTQYPVIFGAAQRASHIPNSIIYVSPAFICFNKDTYEKLGKPSFNPTIRGDVGAEITYKANEMRFTVDYLWPSSVQEPKWPLRENELFGLGTTYDNSIYHAFESRMNHNSTNMFLKKCEHILRD